MHESVYISIGQKEKEENTLAQGRNLIQTAALIKVHTLARSVPVVARSNAQIEGLNRTTAISRFWPHPHARRLEDHTRRIWGKACFQPALGPQKL